MRDVRCDFCYSFCKVYLKFSLHTSDFVYKSGGTMLKKIWKHFKLITKHKWIVFKLCCRVGMPWRGLIHDLSKYSPTEFF